VCDGYDGAENITIVILLHIFRKKNFILKILAANRPLNLIFPCCGQEFSP
jgi:hypothetical protein